LRNKGMFANLFKSVDPRFEAAIENDLREIVGGHPSRGIFGDVNEDAEDRINEIQLTLKWSASIMMTDVDNQIVAVSPSFEEFTGYSACECVGQSPRFLQGQDSSDGAISQFRALFLTRKPGTVGIINYRKTGEPFLDEVMMFPMHNSLKEFIGYVSRHRMM